MITVKNIPKEWTGNTCTNCGEQGTRLCSIDSDFDDVQMDLCTRCFNLLYKKMTKLKEINEKGLLAVNKILHIFASFSTILHK